MANTTLLQLKNWFARFIGENDYTSIESVATTLLDDALKEVSSLQPFECNKTSAEIVVSSGVGTLPTNLDFNHIGEIKVYRYSGTTQYEYERVDFDDFSNYDSSQYIYAIDRANEKIKLPSDVTINVDYYKIPADLSINIDTTNIPVPKAIARMAAGQYWQSFEDDPDQAKLNFEMASNLIQQAVRNNKMNIPYRKIKTYGDRDLGFN